MRPILAFVLTAVLSIGSTQAMAQSGMRTEGDVATAQGVYEAEVPVNSQADSDRSGALARALAQVLAKMSGDRQVTSRPGVARMLREAGSYVRSYDYRQDRGTSASGAPSYRMMLVARFDAEQVEGLASALGLPVWAQPRPKPVLWLAIDDGSGPRLVSVQQSNAARPLLDKAIERGYRLGLPAGGAAEQALVGAIWRQDTTAIARASARYAPPMQLVGKLYRGNGGGWVADWVFVDNGRVLDRWSARETDARRAMANGADGAADALVRRYAKALPSGAPGVHRIIVHGLNSADDWLRVSASLQAHPMLKSIRPLRATGDRLELDLELMTGLAGFNRLLGADAALVPVSATPMVGQTADGVPATVASGAAEYRVK